MSRLNAPVWPNGRPSFLLLSATVRASLQISRTTGASPVWRTIQLPPARYDPHSLKMLCREEVRRPAPPAGQRGPAADAASPHVHTLARCRPAARRAGGVEEERAKTHSLASPRCQKQSLARRSTRSPAPRWRSPRRGAAAPSRFRTWGVARSMTTRSKDRPGILPDRSARLGRIRLRKGAGRRHRPAARPGTGCCEDPDLPAATAPRRDRGLATHRQRRQARRRAAGTHLLVPGRAATVRAPGRGMVQTSGGRRLARPGHAAQRGDPALHWDLYAHPRAGPLPAAVGTDPRRAGYCPRSGLCRRSAAAPGQARLQDRGRQPGRAAETPTDRASSGADRRPSGRSGT